MAGIPCSKNQRNTTLPLATASTPNASPTTGIPPNSRNIVPLAKMLSSLALPSTIYSQSYLTHNSRLMHSLLERYEKIALQLANAPESENVDGSKGFKWLYTDMGLDEVGFDQGAFEYLRSKFNKDVVPHFKIMLEWDNFQVRVKTRPSRPHDATKSCLDTLIILWLNNAGAGDADALERLGSSGSPSI